MLDTELLLEEDGVAVLEWLELEETGVVLEDKEACVDEDDGDDVDDRTLLDEIVEELVTCVDDGVLEEEEEEEDGDAELDELLDDVVTAGEDVEDFIGDDVLDVAEDTPPVVGRLGLAAVYLR